MFLISFIRIVKFAIQDFFRNFWLSLITISIVVLTIFSINVLTVVQILTSQAISEVEDKIDLSITFLPKAPQTDIEKIKAYLAQNEDVTEIIYLSPDEVLSAFKERHKDNKTLTAVLEELEENPLGAMLVIRADKIDDYETILANLENNEDLPLESILTKDFQDYRVVIRKINSITTSLTQIGYGVSIIFLVITVLIMFNTIRVAIYTHREEIAIMKLVGASNMFVRAPFLIEALWLSVIAFMISLLIWFPILGVLQPYFNGFFSTFDLTNFILDNAFMIFGYQFGVLLLVNLLSAFVAIHRYLKV